jgi:predicted acyl esterase
LGGTVIADLFTSLTGTDADFIVKVIDVLPSDFQYPDEQYDSGRNGSDFYPMGDYQMLVRGEVMRGKYRNSFEKPQPFVPNKVEKVRFELPDVAHVFKKGHRIMVQIQSTWFPLVDRNPQKFVNIYEAEESDYQKTTIKIWHDNTFPSSIILPVIK